MKYIIIIIGDSMDDKEKILRLYYKMGSIQSKITELQNDINTLTQVLDNNFSINDKTVYKDTIEGNKNIASGVKNSVNTVRYYLRSSL